MCTTNSAPLTFRDHMRLFLIELRVFRVLVQEYQSSKQQRSLAQVQVRSHLFGPGSLSLSIYPRNAMSAVVSS